MTEKRNQQIKFASWVGIVGNSILAVVKIFVGIISGSFAVIGDGIDTTTDILTYFITLVAARIMNKPPDYKFPYGYNRAEAVATKVLSFVIFFAGAQLFFSALVKIMKDAPHKVPTLLAVYVTVFSILAKIALAVYQLRVGKKIDSNMIIANGKNMRNDIFISVSVLLGLLFIHVFHLPILDLITAIFIGAWIMRSGYGVFMESSRELMDGTDNPDLYYKIFDAVEEVGAVNPHRVRIRKHSNMYTVDLDIEIDGKLTIDQGHKIAKKVELNIKTRIENVYDVLVHIEPEGNQEKEKFGLSRDNIDSECNKKKNGRKI